MLNKEFMTIPELARLLGISRVAVFRKVKKGEISAKKAGKMYLIPKEQINNIIGKTLNDAKKKQIESAVQKTVKEYGEVLKKLGAE